MVEKGGGGLEIIYACGTQMEHLYAVHLTVIEMVITTLSCPASCRLQSMRFESFITSVILPSTTYYDS